MYRLTADQIEHGIELLLKDKPELLGTCLNAIYQDMDGSKAAEEFHKKHMTPSCGVITVYDTYKCQQIVTKIATRIRNKTVVEIGAGIGLLSIAKDKWLFDNLRPIFDAFISHNRYYSIDLLNTILTQKGEDKINNKA